MNKLENNDSLQHFFLAGQIHMFANLSHTCPNGTGYSEKFNHSR